MVLINILLLILFCEVTHGVTQVTADEIKAKSMVEISEQASSPSGISGKGRVYVKTDSKLYFRNSSTEYNLLQPTLYGGNISNLEWIEISNVPTYTVENEFRVYKFQQSLSQEIWTSLRVPSNYLAGTQIKMRVLVYSPDTTGNGLIQSVATLIRTSTDLVSSTTNQRTSTNSAVSFSASTNNKPQLVELDLTSASGQINSVAISGGDIIKVKILRGTDTATSDIRVLLESAEVIY